MDSRLEVKSHAEHTAEQIIWWFAADLIEHGHIDVVRRLAESGDSSRAVVLAYEARRR